MFILCWRTARQFIGWLGFLIVLSDFVELEVFVWVLFVPRCERCMGMMCFCLICWQCMTRTSLNGKCCKTCCAVTCAAFCWLQAMFIFAERRVCAINKTSTCAYIWVVKHLHVIGNWQWGGWAVCVYVCVERGKGRTLLVWVLSIEVLQREKMHCAAGFDVMHYVGCWNLSSTLLRGVCGANSPWLVLQEKWHVLAFQTTGLLYAQRRGQKCMCVHCLLETQRSHC